MKLKDICKIKHGYAFKGEYFSNNPTSKVLVTPGNFKIGGGFKNDKLKFYKEIDNFSEDYVLKGNDLIVTMTDLSKNGDTLGYSALIPKDNNIYLHNQRIGLVHSINQNIATKEYIYWFMRTKQYQKQIVCSSSGTTVKHTSPERILDIEIPEYPIDIQNKIVYIMNNIENKIKVNTQINDNLYNVA